MVVVVERVVGIVAEFVGGEKLAKIDVLSSIKHQIGSIRKS